VGATGRRACGTFLGVSRGWGRSRHRRLITAALIFVALFTGLAALTAEPRLDLDREARALVGLTRSPGLDAVMRAVTLLGEATGLVPLIAAASFGLWRVHRRWALALPLIMAGTGVLQLAAKWAIDRPRPNLAPWGYPSGHMLSLVVLLGLLVYLLHLAPLRRRWRRAAAGLAAGTLSTVAFSRLYLDVHWLSDLGGGLALGAGYLLFAIWLVEVSRGWLPRRAAPAPAPAVEPSVVGAGLAVEPESAIA
jgi:membrane-associated phospholipid phosphatase